MSLSETLPDSINISPIFFICAPQKPRAPEDARMMSYFDGSPPRCHPQLGIVTLRQSGLIATLTRLETDSQQTSHEVPFFVSCRSLYEASRR